MPGWDFAAACHVAQWIAADYYDLFEIPGGRVVFSQADVSVTGMAGALISARLHGMIRSRAEQMCGHLREWIRELNTGLIESTPESMFVSLVIGVIEAQTGHIQLVNACQHPGCHLDGRRA